MSHNLISKDVKVMRQYYDDALKMQGIPAKYQYPSYVDTNAQGEPVIDHYSVPEDTYIFFDGAPNSRHSNGLDGWLKIMKICRFLYIVVSIFNIFRRIVCLILKTIF